jgi:hypothetical protein
MDTETDPTLQPFPLEVPDVEQIDLRTRGHVAAQHGRRWRKAGAAVRPSAQEKDPSCNLPATAGARLAWLEPTDEEVVT